MGFHQRAIPGRDCSLSLEFLPESPVRKTVPAALPGQEPCWGRSALSAGPHLPELLQLVDLLGSDLPGPQLLLLRRDLDQPREEAAVLDQGLPLGAVPVDVLEAALTGAGLPTETPRAGRAQVRMTSAHKAHLSSQSDIPYILLCDHITFKLLAIHCLSPCT